MKKQDPVNLRNPQKQWPVSDERLTPAVWLYYVSDGNGVDAVPSSDFERMLVRFFNLN